MSSKHELKNTGVEIDFVNIKDQTKLIQVGNNITKNIVLNIENKHVNIEINVGENSFIKVLILSVHESNIKINLIGKVSRYGTLNLIAGFLNDHTELEAKIYLNDKYAEANVNSLVVSHNNQQQKLYYEIINNATETNANIDVIGIGNDNGKVIVSGVGQINKGMHNSNNFQHLTGVISDQAVVEMNPYLLIDEHDVKAGHGATIGQVDEEILYYMMSRGIPKKEAQTLYMKGVVSPFVDQIFDKDLCEDFSKILWGESL